MWPQPSASSTSTAAAAFLILYLDFLSLFFWMYVNYYSLYFFYFSYNVVHTTHSIIIYSSTRFHRMQRSLAKVFLFLYIGVVAYVNSRSEGYVGWRSLLLFNSEGMNRWRWAGRQESSRVRRVIRRVLFDFEDKSSRHSSHHTLLFTRMSQSNPNLLQMPTLCISWTPKHGNNNIKVKKSIIQSSKHRNNCK
jgi:hypothetical protein